MTHEKWRPFPARQYTGNPLAFRGYVGHAKVERHCCARMHQTSVAAEECAKRVAKRLNRIEVKMDEGQIELSQYHIESGGVVACRKCFTVRLRPQRPGAPDYCRVCALIQRLEQEVTT